MKSGIDHGNLTKEMGGGVQGEIRAFDRDTNRNASRGSLRILSFSLNLNCS